MGLPKEVPYIPPSDYGVCASLAVPVPPSVREANYFTSIEALKAGAPVLAEQLSQLVEDEAASSPRTSKDKGGILPQDVGGWHKVFDTSRDDVVKAAQAALERSINSNAVKGGKPRKITECEQDTRDRAKWSDSFRKLEDAAFCNPAHPSVQPLAKVRVFARSGAPNEPAPGTKHSQDVDGNSEVSFCV